MPQDIAAELKAFVAAPAPTIDARLKEAAGDEMLRFLDARMDQVRIYHALRASKALLDKVDGIEAFAFQDAVLRKERTGQIAYHSQRDHTCHTLNNFLLGWYIYHHSDSLNKSFSNQFKRRKLGVDKPDQAKFAAIWMYVSLLHDIGYIFEGDFSKPGSFEKDEGIKTAVECLMAFFDDSFWTHNMLADSDRDALIDANLMPRYVISNASIEQLSDRLQQIPSLHLLLQDVQKAFSDPISSLTIDNAFDLWSENYRYFGNSKMATKITQLKLDFEKLRKDGLGKDKIKILNHAVCSGLILLQSTSYYYMLHSAIGASKRSGTLIDVVGRYELKDRNYSVDLWWAGLVWATAATAIHDRYQALVTKKRSGDKLSFADDPLAFLGILVDEMQFWDRFKVFDLTKDHKFDDVPTQSSEVTLGVQGGKIQFAAPAHEIVTLEKSLNERLSDWRQIVSVTASN